MHSTQNLPLYRHLLDVKCFLWTRQMELQSDCLSRCPFAFQPFLMTLCLSKHWPKGCLNFTTLHWALRPSIEWSTARPSWSPLQSGCREDIRQWYDLQMKFKLKQESLQQAQTKLQNNLWKFFTQLDTFKPSFRLGGPNYWWASRDCNGCAQFWQGDFSSAGEKQIVVLIIP